MIRLSSPCTRCDAIDFIEVDDERGLKYIDGNHSVQDVWPELSAAEREIIIGFKKGHHLCNTCWDEVFADDE